MLNPGDKAPDITLPDQNGNTVDLSDLRGKTVVLFFYPKADTPGCTKEACAFNEAKAQFESANTVLLGISADPVDAQQKFADKYGLTMPLLADADHAIAEAYGVWGEKSMYGKTYMGIARTTFIIGPDGALQNVFRDVKVDGHSDEVLRAIS